MEKEQFELESFPIIDIYNFSGSIVEGKRDIHKRSRFCSSVNKTHFAMEIKNFERTFPDPKKIDKLDR